MTESAPAHLPASLDDATAEHYLRRIDVEPPASADLASLTLLMRAHLVAVPFENLDVFHLRPVSTALDWSIPKIVGQGRGGWCFELNGTFGALLQTLAFDVRYLGAAVLPVSYTHLTLPTTPYV